MSTWNEQDLSEYFQNPNSYSIIDVQDLQDARGIEDFNQDDFFNEWEAEEVIIRELEERMRPDDAQLIGKYLRESKEMHARIKRLRDKLIQELSEATKLKKHLQNKAKRDELARENISLKQEIDLLREQIDTNKDDSLTMLKMENIRLILQNKTLKKQLDFEHKKRQALDKSKRVRGTKKLSRKLKYAAIEAVKAEQEARLAIQQTKETITNRARKAGLAKQSPYEKAGTIKAVNELLAEKQDLLKQRGGKAALNKMILDLIAIGDIPAPNTPSAKTVDSWIDKFRKTQSAS
ncbi:hypothetical protein LVJ83_11905 [Uruburuella testudinis]|uniref:Uncharacterized protein n=1 Tax=Uruburuella testudinis TaxID=1282863 RepID=A0ABY4DVI0_9NEIS|nr:hypothetical protein [Uruburuella testudinis]UOO81612.1 hypothetical protein LVJ83_11905 [Uruburuella testudinis]